MFSTIRREIAAVLVGLVAIATHFVPGLEIDPLVIELGAGALALAVLVLVENRIDGISVRELAAIAAEHLVRDARPLEAQRRADALTGRPRPRPADGPIPYKPGPRQAVAEYPIPRKRHD